MSLYACCKSIFRRKLPYDRTVTNLTLFPRILQERIVFTTLHDTAWNVGLSQPLNIPVSNLLWFLFFALTIFFFLLSKLLLRRHLLLYTSSFVFYALSCFGSFPFILSSSSHPSPSSLIVLLIFYIPSSSLPTSSAILFFLLGFFSTSRVHIALFSSFNITLSLFLALFRLLIRPLYFSFWSFFVLLMTSSLSFPLHSLSFLINSILIRHEFSPSQSPSPSLFSSTTPIFFLKAISDPQVIFVCNSFPSSLTSTPSPNVAAGPESQPAAMVTRDPGVLEESGGGGSPRQPLALWLRLAVDVDQCRPCSIPHWPVCPGGPQVRKRNGYI